MLTDVDAGILANVVWVTPTAAASDHAGSTDGSGPSWVASVVNTIGESQYWNATAIFVTWDDWGGSYDPIAPPDLQLVRARIPRAADRDLTVRKASTLSTCSMSSAAS